MNNAVFSLKMRAAEGAKHVSGAERIVRGAAVAKTVAQLAERALEHPKGEADFINVKIERLSAVAELEALEVTNNVTASAAEGRALAAKLLKEAGVARIDEIFALFPETYGMRGAMLLDGDTLERLEPDRGRGVRATYMDDAESLSKGGAGGKNHYAEAIVLATKVANAPGIVGEICVSDDPDYVTGYVATKAIGYQRITTIKTKGDPSGGRIFLYRGNREDVAKTIGFLERTPVIVRNVPVLSVPMADRRRASIAADLEGIRAAGLERKVVTLEGATGPSATVDGRPAVVMSSNDYLDLARDERVIAAAVEATRRYGAGTGGSRLTTGTQPPHVELERKLAEFKGTDAAILFATGYMANVGTITAMVKKGDAILSDELNHASIIDGARLSGAEIFVYRHNDMADFERKLALTREFRRRLAVSDAVFSMDGDILDYPKFLELCRRHDAFSMVDEAHSTGVLGLRGHGIAEHFGCGNADLMLGTLSKALGSEGGFVAAEKMLGDYLRNRARSFIFSTAAGAGAAAAAKAALGILEAEPERVARLRENTAFFLGELRRGGIEAASESAIVPIVIGDERRAMAAAAELRERGFLIPAIRYPTVARGQARLRVAIMSAHTRSELSAAAAAIRHVMRLW